MDTLYLPPIWANHPARSWCCYTRRTRKSARIWPEPRRSPKRPLRSDAKSEIGQWSFPVDWALLSQSGRRLSALTLIIADKLAKAGNLLFRTERVRGVQARRPVYRPWSNQPCECKMDDDLRCMHFCTFVLFNRRIQKDWIPFLKVKKAKYVMYRVGQKDCISGC